jgi:surface polysaccharide O-acyltransferase-like enzyme
LIVLGWLVTAIGTYYFTQKSGYFKGDFYHYLSPNVLLMSVGIFLLVKQISIKSNGLNTVIKMISTYSFGIYLSHVSGFEFAQRMGNYRSMDTSLMGAYR